MVSRGGGGNKSDYESGAESDGQAEREKGFRTVLQAGDVKGSKRCGAPEVDLDTAMLPVACRHLVLVMLDGAHDGCSCLGRT